jgi:site-specific DNA-methyltransferase (adenine-specific)
VKPYYEADGITIYHGDCREILLDLEPVDLVFTSPPYNLGGATNGGLRGSTTRGKWRAPALSNGYASHDDAMPHERYVAWQRSVLRLCWAAIKPSGAIFYNHKPLQRDGEVRLPLELNPELPLRQILIWQRAGGLNFSPTHYLPTHEWILILAKPEFRLTSRGASGVGDVWTVPQEANTEHPAPFPVGLPLRAIETTGAPTVLDPFMGSGTTLRAAKDLGRKAIGIEIEERYCEIAAKRLAQRVLFAG